MEKSTKSEELSRRRLKTVSMSDRTLPNSDNGSERRASMPIVTIRPLSDGIERPEGANDAPLPKNLVRSQSFEMESPEMMNKLDLQGRTQRRMKSVSMPEKTLQNMATGIGKREDTIDEESRDELGRAINARPISREIRNLEGTIDEESRDELGQAINARPISREIRNQEDTIDEESRDELGQAINARPISREIRNQASVSTREQRALRREIEKRVNFNRSYTTPSSVSKEKQSILRRKLTEREFTQEEILRVQRSEEESYASVSVTKQRTSHRETKQRVCKDMKNKALPDQVEAETFQTKGCQYDYVENKTHSTKSMSFRIYVTPHKGLVLVIVNFSFPNKPLKRGNDIEEIKELFPDYGYEVYSFTDLNKEDILSKVKLYSEKENVDRFICFISSHGNQTSLACPDGGVVRINDILSAANTKQLENKPKVFFFDACRANLNQDIKESDWPEPPSTEYYVGFSCLASKISLVGKDSCGIYFQALIEVFKDGFWRSPKEDSIIRDINHFMEKVHHRVNKQKDKQGNNYQMPIFRSTLTGKLFLQGDEIVSDTLHNISIY